MNRSVQKEWKALRSKGAFNRASDTRQYPREDAGLPYHAGLCPGGPYFSPDSSGIVMEIVKGKEKLRQVRLKFLIIGLYWRLTEQNWKPIKIVNNTMKCTRIYQDKEIKAASLVVLMVFACARQCSFKRSDSTNHKWWAWDSPISISMQ